MSQTEMNQRPVVSNTGSGLRGIKGCHNRDKSKASGFKHMIWHERNRSCGARQNPRKLEASGQKRHKERRLNPWRGWKRAPEWRMGSRWWETYQDLWPRQGGVLAYCLDHR